MVSPGTRPLPGPRGARLASPPVWSLSSLLGCLGHLWDLRDLCPPEVGPSSNRLVPQLRDPKSNYRALDRYRLSLGDSQKQTKFLLE